MLGEQSAGAAMSDSVLRGAGVPRLLRQLLDQSGGLLPPLLHTITSFALEFLLRQSAFELL